MMYFIKKTHVLILLAFRLINIFIFLRTRCFPRIEIIVINYVLYNGCVGWR